MCQFESIKREDREDQEVEGANAQQTGVFRHHRSSSLSSNRVFGGHNFRTGSGAQWKVTTDVGGCPESSWDSIGDELGYPVTPEVLRPRMLSHLVTLEVLIQDVLGHPMTPDVLKLRMSWVIL